MKNLFISLLLILSFFSCSKQPTEYTLEVSISPQNSGTVTPSSGIYEDGTTVTIQGTPSDGYIFKEWSGSVSGSTNPITVSMNSDKVIVGVFEKKQYPLTITIEGEGTVTEELIQTKSTTYPHGSEVKLTGVPSEGWKFVEWSGDITSDENPITINIESEISVHIKFEKECVDSYPLIDLKQPSYFTNILFHPPNILDILSENDCEGYGYGMDKISTDYNRDGYLDFVGFFNDYGTENRHYIKFFQSDCYGNLTLDEDNSDKFLGMVHGRKILIGDYNNDDYTDIFLIGHGYDSDPFPGEYPVVLFGSENGIFSEKRLTDWVGFFHGGSSGDFDNDGDLDVILVTGTGSSTVLLENDGMGNFIDNSSLLPREELFMESKYSSEFYDIDGDGNLELFLFGGEGNDNDWKFVPSGYITGNGVDFSGEFQPLPEVKLWEMVLDMDFYDIDSNGSVELILNRTKPNYQGWYIQIIEMINGEFVDSTEKFIDNYYSETENWNVWLYIDDFNKNGQVELRNSELPNFSHLNFLNWTLTDGKFHRVN